MKNVIPYFTQSESNLKITDICIYVGVYFHYVVFVLNFKSIGKKSLLSESQRYTKSKFYISSLSDFGFLLMSQCTNIKVLLLLSYVLKALNPIGFFS